MQKRIGQYSFKIKNERRVDQIKSSERLEHFISLLNPTLLARSTSFAEPFILN